ncbi:MAG: membrane assembly protein AsmA [Bacteroidia bacterium]|nr:membrane assembly protein AsmA [Bacteroidia bacterium]
MKKKILYGILIFIGLFIATLVALPFLFKDKIIAKVKEEANKRLDAKMDFGDFDLTLIRSFPNLRFELENFSLVGIKDFEGDTLVYVKSFDVNLDLMSVINGGQYKVNGLFLNQPKIKALKLSNGLANWNIVKPTPPEEKKEEKEGSTSFSLSLKKLEITDAIIRFDDDSSNIHTYLKDLDYALSGDFSDAQTTLENELKIERMDLSYGGITYFNKTKVALDAEVDADLVKSKYVLKDNSLVLNALELAWEGWVEMPANDINMDLKFGAKKTEFKNILSLIPAVFMKDFESVKTSGKLALDGYAKGVYNERILPAFGLKILVENGYFKYPSLPKDVKNIALQVDINGKGTPDNTVIDIKKFHFDISENPVDISLLVKTPVSDPSIKGEILGKINLGSLGDVIPLEKEEKLNGSIIADIKLEGKQSMIDKQEYEKFKADGQLILMDIVYNTKAVKLPVEIKKAYLNFSPQFLDLSQFEAKIGKSDLNMKGKIENFLAYYFKNETLKGDFTFQSTYLNADELMASVPEDDEPAAPDTAALTAPDIPANLDVKLATSIGHLVYDVYDLKNISGTVLVKHKQADLSGLKASMLDGQVTMNGTYNVENLLKPKVNFDFSVADFDIQKTFKTFNTVEKLAPIAKQCQGKFSTGLKFAAVMDNALNPDLKTLSGGGILTTKTVTISNFEPLNKVADALKMDKYKKLALNDVKVQYEFKDGKVEVKPYDLALGKSNVNIAGFTGFDQSLDYNMKFTIPTSEMPAQATQAVNGLLAQANKAAGTQLSLGEKVNIDVKVGGTIAKPTVKTGLKDAAKNAVDDLKKQAEELAKQKLKEAEDKARAEADKLKKQAEEEAAKMKKQAEDKAKAEAEKLKAEAEKKKKELEAKAKAEADKAKKAAEEKAKKEAEKGLRNIFGGKK